MASLMRRSLVTVKNIKKCRKLCVLVESERHQSRRIPKQNVPGILNHNLKAFHTSTVTNEIISFKLSDIGEGIREVVIKEWVLYPYCVVVQTEPFVRESDSHLAGFLLLKQIKPDSTAPIRLFVKVGDRVSQFDNICEVQSDKAAVTITSRFDGVVTKLYHEVDQTALVGQPLVDIEVEGDTKEDTSADNVAKVITKDETSKEQSISQRVKVLTTPSVRRIASQFKVDLSTVKSTGRNGRILKEDVLSYLNMSSDSSNIVPDAINVATASIPVTGAKVRTEVILEDKIVPITGFTRAMVKSMTEAMKIPHFGFSDEYDVTKLVEARAELKTVSQERGVKLTYMPLIIKAASLSLRAYPVLNSSLDEKCENLIYKASHNIGVAMDTPSGLVVPIIRNVEQKSILEIARDLNALQEKGFKGRLGMEDLTGGTFTLSNIGIVGGTYTKPIILPPQVSIGALGKIQVLPRFDANGNVTKAHILTVSWSADHRVIDGVTMARFSQQLKSYLENPYKFLLDL